MPAEVEADRSCLPVTMSINGKRVHAKPGQTILEVVREQNIEAIPSRCYDPKLEPYGSCFLCVVEVKGSPRLLPACVTRVRDGMEVTTRSERIVNARRTALELLLSDHYADCVCPARNACPAGVDIQGYLSLAGLGYYSEALALIKERNPLPVVCGRVCVRKCEVKCLRNRVDEPVGVNFIKRYVSEHSMTVSPKKAPPSGQRVAVVGGGPGGLSCANFLALKGHEVTIYETLPKLGGMLRYGIPAYRLPRIDLDEEIRGILDLGIRVETSKTLGKDFTIENLLGRFDAVFLAMGAPIGKKMGVPGEEQSGHVRSALEFLRSVELSGPPRLQGKVAVVGGGNSAIDAARTALRCGAEEVRILYRRTRKEMPADPEEIEAAEREGVKIDFLVAPLEIRSESDGNLKCLICRRMELGKPDADGRRSPIPIEGSEVEYACQTIFSAIGQDTDLACLHNEPDWARPGLGRRGTLDADCLTMATRAKGVFAGGDVVVGPAAVIDAIAHGRLAAEAIDWYLKTGEVKAPETIFQSRRDPASLPDWLFENVARSKRAALPEREVGERVRDFAPVEHGLPESEMKREARRCMECGCSAIFKCELRRFAAEYGVDIAKFSGEARRHRVDRSHPFITLDPNKCILCARCIRTCGERVGLGVLGFVGRGFGTVVEPARGVPMSESACIACGACVESCPTGAISARLPHDRQGPWRGRRTHSVCNFCSLGCELDLNVVSEGLLWASSSSAPLAAENDLCWKGRFGTGLIHGLDRLHTPLVRRDGRLVEAGWDEAIEAAAAALRQYRREQGANSITVLAAPRMTLEEAVLIRHLAAKAIQSKEVGSFGQNRRGGPRSDLDSILGSTSSTCLQDDLERADLILLSGADPGEAYPVLAMAIRRAARRGAKIIAVNSCRTGLLGSSDLWLDARRGTAGILYAGLMNYFLNNGLSRIEGLEEAALSALRSSVTFATPDTAAKLTGIDSSKIHACAQWLTSARRVVAIYDLEDTLERATDDLLALAQIMALTGRIKKAGQGLLLLRSDCNAEGARLAGIANAIRLEAIQGALVMFENPSGDSWTMRECREFEPLVVIDHFLTETAQRAAVVLPASTLAETEGTVVTYDRKVKKVSPGCRPASGLTTGEVIARLSLAMGHPVPSVEPLRLRAELAALLAVDPRELENARDHGLPLRARSDRPFVPAALRLDATAAEGNLFQYATLDAILGKKAAAFGLRVA